MDLDALGGIAMFISVSYVLEVTFLFMFSFRFQEDQVKSQKSPQVEEGVRAMVMVQEAKREGNATMLLRSVNQ